MHVVWKKYQWSVGLIYNRASEVQVLLFKQAVCIVSNSGKHVVYITVTDLTTVLLTMFIGIIVFNISELCLKWVGRVEWERAVAGHAASQAKTPDLVLQAWPINIQLCFHFREEKLFLPDFPHVWQIRPLLHKLYSIKKKQKKNKEEGTQVDSFMWFYLTSIILKWYKKEIETND